MGDSRQLFADFLIHKYGQPEKVLMTIYDEFLTFSSERASSPVVSETGAQVSQGNFRYASAAACADIPNEYSQTPASGGALNARDWYNSKPILDMRWKNAHPDSKMSREDQTVAVLEAWQAALASRICK